MVVDGHEIGAQHLGTLLLSFSAVPAIGKAATRPRALTCGMAKAPIPPRTAMDEEGLAIGGGFKTRSRFDTTVAATPQKQPGSSDRVDAHPADGTCISARHHRGNSAATSARQPGGDLVADRPAFDGLADRLPHAPRLSSPMTSEIPLGGGWKHLPLQRVGAVHPRGHHAYQQLARPGHQVRGLRRS